MAEKQIALDLIADVASPTEIVFEDGETSTEWLAPYDLRLTVLNASGPNGYPEVNIIGEEDNLRRFLAEKLPDVDDLVEDVN
ncbi:hypothetical protein pEaSNUABM20_00251 [Erwinia phage pEa_SNUABM_20]|nr:hypothetical protein pEaSNUABM20_00251 [Erwinia phage pEa_SNUABM_20]